MLPCQKRERERERVCGATVSFQMRSLHPSMSLHWQLTTGISPHQLTHAQCLPLVTNQNHRVSAQDHLASLESNYSFFLSLSSRILVSVSQTLIVLSNWSPNQALIFLTLTLKYLVSRYFLHFHKNQKSPCCSETQLQNLEALTVRWRSKPSDTKSYLWYCNLYVFLLI